MKRYQIIPLVIGIYALVQFADIIKVIIGFFMIKSNVWLQNIVNSY